METWVESRRPVWDSSERLGSGDPGLDPHRGRGAVTPRDVVRTKWRTEEQCQLLWAPIREKDRI